MVWRRMICSVVAISIGAVIFVEIWDPELVRAVYRIAIEIKEWIFSAIVLTAAAIFRRVAPYRAFVRIFAGISAVRMGNSGAEPCPDSGGTCVLNLQIAGRALPGITGGLNCALNRAIPDPHTKCS